MRKTRWLWAAALCLSLTAHADTSADPPGGKKKPPVKAKAKTGESCKTNSDCEQTGRGQACINNTCAVIDVHPVT